MLEQVPGSEGGSQEAVMATQQGGPQAPQPPPVSQGCIWDLRLAFRIPAIGWVKDGRLRVRAALLSHGSQRTRRLPLGFCSSERI